MISFKISIRLINIIKTHLRWRIVISKHLQILLPSTTIKISLKSLWNSIKGWYSLDMSLLRSGTIWVYAVSRTINTISTTTVFREPFLMEEMIRSYIVMYGIISAIFTPYSASYSSRCKHSRSLSPIVPIIVKAWIISLWFLPKKGRLILQ